MAFTRLNYEHSWTDKPWTGEGAFFPTYQDSETQVRKDLQYHPDVIRDAFNKFLDELAAATAAEFIGDAQKGTLAATLTDIYTTLKTLDENLRSLADGDTPDAWRSKIVEFGAEDWTEGEDSWSYVIPVASHGRIGPEFGYQLWCEDEDGVLRSDAWAAVATDVSYDEETDNITLTTEEPYGGHVVFFGV